MEKVLIINEPGLYIHIPGTPPCRTPAKIDISNIDEELVFAELRKLGLNTIDRFKIEDKPKTLKEKIIKKINTIITTDNKEVLKEMKKHQSSIDRIELMLKEFLEAKVVVNQPVGVEQTTIKKKVFDDDLAEFIPSIDLSKIKSKIK